MITIEYGRKLKSGMWPNEVSNPNFGLDSCFEFVTDIDAFAFASIHEERSHCI